MFFVIARFSGFESGMLLNSTRQVIRSAVLVQYFVTKNDKKYSLNYLLLFVLGVYQIEKNNCQDY